MAADTTTDTAAAATAPAPTAAAGDAGDDDTAGPRLPHELIPAHIRDKGQAELRRSLIKAAEGELAAVKHLFQSDPEQWSQEVLCARFMKRKTLAIAAADPAKPDRRPLLPLDVLCEAKVSASAQVFIKCSCEACGGGAVSHAGGCFHSVEDWAAHARALFGGACLPVLSEVQLSWQELLELLGRESVPPDHLWWCLLCEEELPGAPLRCCDACQLACHGACYTRRYGQPLAPGADGRVLCISCQNPAFQTLQELQAPKLGSKAGTARYTVPPLPHEVFRRETNPSHFSKGTYDFWGRNQANLMDALVLKKGSPEAEACAAAIAAAAAAAAPAAAAGADGDGGEAAADAVAAAPAAAAGAGAGPSGRATHVLIATDPDGRLVSIDYEFGKLHKTHGENRKLWVVPLLEALGMNLGDLLVATRPPLDQQQQQRQQWGEALAGCDRVLQLHVIRKGARPPAAADNATSRAAALAAANAATQAARRAAAAAAAAARGGVPAAAAAGAVVAAAAVQRPAQASGRPQHEQPQQGRRQRQERQQQQSVLQGGDLRAMLAAAGNSGTRHSSGSVSSDDDEGDDAAAAAAAGSDGDYEESEAEEEEQAAGDSSDYEADEGRRGKRRAKKAAGGGSGGKKGGSRGGRSKGSSAL